MIEQRLGDWIQTRNGIRFYPLDPRPEEILLDDIAFALAYTNRFNGHVGRYSVAEHSCRVCKELEAGGFSTKMQLAGLLHDAAEAYVADVPRPVKVCMRERGDTSYDEAESLVMSAVEERFGLDDRACSSPPIKTADAVLLATERRDLFKDALEWSALPEPLWKKIRPWPAHQAYLTFSSYAARLAPGSALDVVTTANQPQRNERR